MADANPINSMSKISEDQAAANPGSFMSNGATARGSGPVEETHSSIALSDAPQCVRVGSASAMRPRTEVRVRGRRITVLRTPDQHGAHPSWAAIDAVCYHAGGPVGPYGTFVAVGDRMCLRCPWHSYLIDVHTGEGLYKDFDGKLRSKGIKQRVHEVELRADGGIWVRLADARHDKVASDEYAYGPKHPGIVCDYYDVRALDW
jgi:nitrite reductase/ring-hydroxylating ferredoxin subunit